MPQVFKVSDYLVYFWTNEGKPLEPIHVHITNDVPNINDTKIWITAAGKCLICHNKSKIPNHKLSRIIKIIEARNKEVLDKWQEYFGEISYYC